MRLLLAIVAFALLPLPALAAECRATSGPSLRPLVELYTSEGCNSCPPADRWLSALFAAGERHDAIPLAFHVDYWDRLGWTDRFARAEFTARQYAAADAARNRVVYTPQVLLQGRELRRWQADGRGAIAAAARDPAQANLRMTVRAADTGVWIDVEAQPDRAVAMHDAVLYVAYVDSGLVSRVAAGENRGARLVHDHAVRELRSATVYSKGPTRATFSIVRPAERGQHAQIVAFVQNRATGAVLQSLALPLAGCG
jgi:hypothetical protein